MKKFIILFIVFWTSNHIFSQESSLKLNTSIGFSTSKVNELVYTNGVKESLLEWKNSKPLIVTSIRYYLKNFLLDFKVQSSIPVALGTVTDKDFFQSKENTISLFSQHDLITDKDYLFELNISYKFVFPCFDIGFGFTNIYSNIKMEATDGYLQYPMKGDIWTGTEEKEYLNGTVISYEQSRFFDGFFLFLQKDLSLISFLFSYSFYPFIQIDCIDNHFLRSIQFLDKMNTGFAYKIKSNIVWKLKKQKGIIFAFDFTYLDASGKTSINPLGKIIHETTYLDENCIVTTSYYDLIFTLGFVIKI